MAWIRSSLFGVLVVALLLEGGLGLALPKTGAPETLAPQSTSKSKCASLETDGGRRVECGGHGACQDGICQCNEGYTGALCQTDLNEVKLGYVTTYKIKGCPQGKNHDSKKLEVCGGSKQGTCTMSGCECVKPFKGKACEWVEFNVDKLMTKYDKSGQPQGSYCFCKDNPTHASCQPKKTDVEVRLVPDKRIRIKPTHVKPTTPTCPKRVIQSSEYKAEHDKWDGVLKSWTQSRQAEASSSPRRNINYAASDVKVDPPPELLKEDSTCAFKCNTFYCTGVEIDANHRVYRLGNGISREMCERECNDRCGIPNAPIRRHNFGVGEVQEGRLKGEIKSYTPSYTNAIGDPYGECTLTTEDGKEFPLSPYEFRSQMGHELMADRMYPAKVFYSMNKDNKPWDVAVVGSNFAYRATTDTYLQEMEEKAARKAEEWGDIKNCADHYLEVEDMKEKLDRVGAYTPWLDARNPRYKDTLPRCCPAKISWCGKTARQQTLDEIYDIYVKRFGAPTRKRSGSSPGSLVGRYVPNTRYTGSIVAWSAWFIDEHGITRGKGTLKSDAGDEFTFTSWERRVVPLSTMKAPYGGAHAYSNREYMYNVGDIVYFTPQTKDRRALDVASEEETDTASRVPARLGYADREMVELHLARLSKNRATYFKQVSDCAAKSSSPSICCCFGNQ